MREKLWRRMWGVTSLSDDPSKISFRRVWKSPKCRSEFRPGKTCSASLDRQSTVKLGKPGESRGLEFALLNSGLARERWRRLAQTPRCPFRGAALYPAGYRCLESRA